MMRNRALAAAAVATMTVSMGGCGGGGAAATATAFVAPRGSGRRPSPSPPPALTPPNPLEGRLLQGPTGQMPSRGGAAASLSLLLPTSGSGAASGGRRGGVTRQPPLRMSTAAPTKDEAADVSDVPLPEMDSDGLYNIADAEQHRAFLEANPDKIIVLKFYAPWCRACKGLAPKFLKEKNDPRFADLPILWSQMSIQHNKDYVKSLGVLALPSVLFYAGSEGLIENFPCGPSKIPIFKKKFADMINSKVDPDTMQLREVDCSSPEMREAEPCKSRAIVDTGPSTELSVGDAVVSNEQWAYLRNDVPYFKDFDDDEFSTLMKKATLQTFEPGQVIMRQGMAGQKFFVIESGEVEVLVKGAFEDPLTTPSNYLGAVVNRLSDNEWFGERSLITGQPRAATIKALEKTRCYAFDQADIPASSVLSGKKHATSERIAQVDEKYGLDFYDIDFITEQFQKANAANQARGSANHPEIIPGVDNDEEAVIQQQPGGGEPPAAADAAKRRMADSEVHVNGDQDMIVALLVRFKLLRHASRCFEYIMGTRPNFGDEGEVRRRSLLVAKLTRAQREEFESVYRLIDADGDGTVSVMELKRVMESVGEEKTDAELRDMINKANPAVDGNVEIGFEDFMGVMAEAEFYYLFMETFQSMDKDNIGFLKASELDRVLCGMRDLVSNDRKSIIDVEDTAMLINYEEFAKMLLGAESSY